jgi:hypothetical protein
MRAHRAGAGMGYQAGMSRGMGQGEGA